jgi:TPR repeat protein
MLTSKAFFAHRIQSQLQKLLTFVAFAAVLQVTPSFAGIENRQQVDEFLPVDCLLPGAVRKLGGQLTYLTARRPVKTTGVNCEIRGGEYVLYDRADYKTALSIWLPMAEQGDARAQNYVGEIYEKGLGTSPDFHLAAQWYGKSAKQEYAPAQVNLGQLHETGKGVDASMDVAIDLYRQAAGIKGKQLKFVSWDYSEEKYASMSGQIEDQGAVLAAQQKRIESLTGKLDTSISREEKLAGEISSARSSYRAELMALEDAKEALAAQQLLMAQSRPQEAPIVSKVDNSAEQKNLEQQRLAMSNQAAGLASQREQLEQQRAQLSQEQAILREKEQELAGLKDRSLQQNQNLAQEQESVADRSHTLETRFTELATLQQALRERHLAVAKKEQLAQQQFSSAESMKKTLAVQQQELDKLKGDVSEREGELASRETALHQKNTQLSKLNTQLATLREQLAENASAFAGTASPDAAGKDKTVTPVIEMIEPRLLATRSKDFVVKTRAGLDQRTIIGRVMSPNPIMELLVNEQNVRVDERGIFQRRVPIRGKETKVSIVAIDNLGLRSDLDFVLGVEEATEQDLLLVNEGQNMPKLPKQKVPRVNFGNYHALLIGNKDYVTLPDLDTTIYDATAFRDVLRDKYGFKTTLLTDASRYDMLSALEKLRAELTEDDNLLIYYAGHGELDEVNTRGHWLPVDAEEGSRANWISNVAISDILNSMSANKVLVVADSCYSGTMTRSTLARLDAGRSNKAWVSWLKKQSNSHSRLLFSSGGVAPVLDGGGGKHSIFAKALLDVLTSNEGVLEGRQVHAQVAQAVSYAALAAQFDQTPMYAPIKFAGHEGGDFLFVAATN